MFKPHEREARIKIKRREINANKTTTEKMKKTYIQPTSTVITMSDNLCDNGILTASVIKGGSEGGEHVDNIEVVEDDKSGSLDWDSSSWGGE